MSWIPITLVLSTLYIASIHADPVTGQCTEVRDAYGAMGYSTLDVPLNSVIVKDDELQICPSGFSCCSRDMEIQLTAHSRTKYDERLLNATNDAKKKLTVVTTELHAFYSNLITKAEADMDEMFTVAYADQYKKNKDVFSGLFSSFKRYYGGQDLDISTVIHQFFKDVFVRMFNLQNPTYNFTEQYLACVGSKMDSIKPFGEYPEKLQRNLKQAFVASRTFIQGLAIGRNVAMTTQQIQPTTACSKAEMKMSFCPHCRGLPSLKPCTGYCLNVMKGCLAYHTELHTSWTAFIDAMDGLAMRQAVDGPFNLESVMNPLKDQVSMAIMEYHSNSNDILHKILDSSTGCGQQPSFSPVRTKRSLSGSAPSRPKTTGTQKRLIEFVQANLREVKTMWGQQLAASMCSTVGSTSPDKCWNGENEAAYLKGLVGDGLLANANNPEVEIDAQRTDDIINEQIKQLSAMTARVINATLAYGNVGWLELQIPLPNITTSTGEGRSVKSDFASDYRFQQSSSGDFEGSGILGANVDDEDLYNSGLGPVWPDKPSIPTIKPGNSGDGEIVHIDTHVDEKETEIVIVRPTEPEAKPDIKKPVQELPYEVKTTSKPRTTTSSSDRVTSSLRHIAVSSIVALITARVL